MDEHNKNIKLPNGEISTLQSFVIVGANGSGKSHLGAWIENNNENVLRISAQRALTIPDAIDIKGGDVSWNTICYGHPTNQYKQIKWNHGHETSTLVNDYMAVLSLVFSKENDELRRYKHICDTSGLPQHYKTTVETILEIWGAIMPQRNLIFERFNVWAKKDGESYKGGYMSDGERVCLYLIAQCLVTPDNYTIVIDEPEIHLHTSIMKKLWDKIEEYCPTKTFVYITHNLKFAISRENATKIWVKSYDGKDNWDFSILEEQTEIPEELYIELLGSRRNVLFVEGKSSSFDKAIYEHVYSDYYVVPCDDCKKVIELTRAFNNEKIKSLHDVEVRGIIDHDFLTEKEIESYNKNGIYTISVSEVENLFLIEPLIRLVIKQIGSDENEVFTNISNFLFEQMENSKSQIISSICEKEIRHKLKDFSTKGDTYEMINNDLSSLVASIDVKRMYEQVQQNIETIISARDYKGMIQIFNNKGLCPQVGGRIGLKKSYSQTILDLLKGEKKEEIITALRGYLPEL